MGLFADLVGTLRSTFRINKATVDASTLTVARTITIPDATDTLVGKATTDTLTNKSLTSPTITGSPVANLSSNRFAINGTSDAVSSVLVSRNTASVTALDSGLGIFNAASDTGSAGFQFASWGGNANFAQGYMSGGTAATPTATPAASNMMLISALGHNGSAYTGSKAVLSFQSLNAWSGSDNSTKMLLRVTPSGSTTLKTIIAVDGTGPTVTGNLTLSAVGNELLIKEGTNASMGTSTLVGGTVTVSNTLVTANTRIFTSVDNPGVVANLGSIYEDGTVRSAGTSFTIKSTNILSTAAVSWLLIEPA